MGAGSVLALDDAPIAPHHGQGWPLRDVRRLINPSISAARRPAHRGRMLAGMRSPGAERCRRRRATLPTVGHLMNHCWQDILGVQRDSSRTSPDRAGIPAFGLDRGISPSLGGVGSLWARGGLDIRVMLPVTGTPNRPQSVAEIAFATGAGAGLVWGKRTILNVTDPPTPL